MILKFELNLTRLISYTNIFLLQTYIFIFEDISIFLIFSMNLIREFFFILTQETPVKNNPLYAKAYIIQKY